MKRTPPRLTAIRSMTAASAMTALIAACGAPDDTPDTDIDIAALHQRILTLDTHVDIPLEYMDTVDPSTETDLQVDFAKMRDGGLDAAFFIVYTPQTEIGPENYIEAREIAETRMRAIEDMVTLYPDQIELALTADDVERIVAAGKLAALVGMENAYPLGPSTDEVGMWAARGVRYVGLTHFGANQFGDSSGTKDYESEDALTTHGGLSDLGRELIGKLNDFGIMVDISHAGDATAMQAIALSRTPVIASHSGVDGVQDHARNMSDAMLEALRDAGGVVQLVALDVYIKAPTPEQQVALDELYAQDGLSDDDRTAMRRRIFATVPAATVSDYVDHIDYAVARIGIDHVGIASDFDGGGGITGWEDASETETVTAELIARGYSEDDIAKIWGGNLLRVMRAVEAGADPAAVAAVTAQ